MAYETLTVEKKEKYLLITLNRPPVNAINVDLLKELGKVLDNEDGDDVLSVVITGAGDKAFCAGADLKSGFGDKPGDLSRLGQDTFSRLENLGKPVIAAVNGLALGGGCELALACTFRIADEKARLGLPESNLGILPGYGGTQRLPRVVGKSKALEMMLYGQPVKADEALEIGLVNSVVDAGTSLEKAEELAKLTATRAPVTTKLILDAVNRGIQTDLQSGLDIERQNFEKVVPTEDAKEGVSAFLEKRKPEFKGK